MTPEERARLFDQFLRCIDREENLIHYRLSWGLQWNIGLFAASFALINLHVEQGLTSLVLALLSVVGLSASGLSFLAIKAAHEQSNFLIDEITRRLEIRDQDWRASEFIRPFGDRSKIHPVARRVSAAFPLVFLAVWIVVFFYAYPYVYAYLLPRSLHH